MSKDAERWDYVRDYLAQAMSSTAEGTHTWRFRFPGGGYTRTIDDLVDKLIEEKRDVECDETGENLQEPAPPVEVPRNTPPKRKRRRGRLPKNGSTGQQPPGGQRETGDDSP